MKHKGRKSHRIVTGAEDRARHRTPGAKRFVHVALSDRGVINPNYGTAVVALMLLSVVFKSRTNYNAQMRRGAR